MPYSDTVYLFEGNFQFGQLECRVYRRFLELLERPASNGFLHTSKKHYRDGITSRGIDTDVHKRVVPGQLHLADKSGSIVFATAEDYRRLEQKYSKFWPYFKFHQLVINFQPWNEQMIDRDPIPVPKMYPILSAQHIKQETDIDYVVKEALHPGVEEIVFGFWKTKLEEVMKLINYTLSKMPGLSEYRFGFRPIKSITEERVLQLFKPPPTTREMTLEITNTTVRYRQKENL